MTPAVQVVIAQLFLDAHDSAAWVRTGDIAAVTGVPGRAVGAWMARRAQAGWFEAQPDKREGSCWHLTVRGRAELSALIAEDSTDEASGQAPTRSEIREWAVAQGCRISPRGNLPVALLQRWNDEHPRRPVQLPLRNSFVTAGVGLNAPESWRRGGLASQESRRRQAGEAS